jgi:hypothetical protein
VTGDPERQAGDVAAGLGGVLDAIDARGLDATDVQRVHLAGASRAFATQLGNLSLKLGDPLSLRCDQSSKLLIGRRRISGHHIMINEPTPRSTRHAGQNLTSYCEAGVFRRISPIVTEAQGPDLRVCTLGRLLFMQMGCLTPASQRDNPASTLPK